MGPHGMIANVPVPQDSSDEDEEQALERLFELIDESGKATERDAWSATSTRKERH